MRIKGKIKKLTDRGFGFIAYNENDIYKDIFFHISDVAPGDKQRLAEGIEVEFEPGTGRNGRPAAKSVAVCSSSGSGTNHPPASGPVITPTESDNSNYFLPADTLKIFDPFDIDNISLFLNKAAYFTGSKFDYRMSRDDRDKRIDPGRYNGVPFKQIIARRKKAIREMGLTSKSLRLYVDWRLVVGLGGTSVYETSMTLHHIYGVPYLPGSAIKGLVRNRVIVELFDNVEGDREKDALSDSGFCHVFGSPENSVTGAYRGAVRFFDAFPVSNPIISLDVMNPHYGPYYAGDKPPADYHNPVPVCFLTVEDASFDISIGINESDNSTIESGVFVGKTPLEVAAEWVEQALKEYGIGAKTSVGYGLFKSE